MSDLLQKLFHAAETVDASDIHLTQDEPAYLRVGGRLVAAKDHPLSDEEIRNTLRQTFNDRQLEHYEARGYVDYAYETKISFEGAEKRIRYRMHLYRSRGGMTAALRRVQLAIPTFEQLSTLR